VPQISLHTQIGDLTVSEDGGKIVALDWGWVLDQDETPLLLNARAQLHSFFDIASETFDLPLEPAGSPFERIVWQAIASIPYGTTVSYGDIAAHIGGSARAVGRAAGANPIPIIIPCHRVVAADGSMHGYSGDGGTDTKKALLILEGALPPPLI